MPAVVETCAATPKSLIWKQGEAGWNLNISDASTGDDAFDLALDTEELLRNPIIGPLAAGTLERFAPGLDPREALFPVTKGLFGLPSPVPIPKLERLYFKWVSHVPSLNCRCYHGL